MDHVSVIIPCYNAAPYLAETLESVVRQVPAPHEVIVVDDASTDGSAEIARGFRGVRVERARFGHACLARNHGFSLSTGRAVMFLDADDVLGPGTLAALWKALPAGGVSVGPWYRLERVGGQWERRPASIPARRLGQDLLGGWLTGRYYPPCVVLWDREAFARTGGWDATLECNHDGDLMYRHLGRGGRWVRATEGFGLYRRVPNSQSSRGKTAAGVAARLRILERLQEFLRERGKVGRYSADLAEAYGDVARDSAGISADVHAKAWERQKALSPRGPRRHWREARRRIEDRTRHYLGRLGLHREA